MAKRAEFFRDRTQGKARTTGSVPESDSVREVPVVASARPPGMTPMTKPKQDRAIEHTLSTTNGPAYGQHRTTILSYAATAGEERWTVRCACGWQAPTSRRRMEQAERDAARHVADVPRAEDASTSAG
jgi:hypothetical protein